MAASPLGVVDRPYTCSYHPCIMPVSVSRLNTSSMVEDLVKHQAVDCTVAFHGATLEASRLVR